MRGGVAFTCTTSITIDMSCLIDEMEQVICLGDTTVYTCLEYRRNAFDVGNKTTSTA